MAAAAFSALKTHAEEIKQLHLRDLLQDSERCAAMQVEHGGIVMDFSRQRATTATMAMLTDLAQTCSIEAKRAAMSTGQKINCTEKRAVLHMALRAPKGKTIMSEGKDVVAPVHEVLDRIADFSARVRSGGWLGATGKKLTTVLAVGIGGSYLGPEFVYEALRCEPACAAAAEGRSLRFLANVDPADFARATAGLDAETTLVVVISKTFTTAETMLNANTVKTWLLSSISGQPADVVVRQHVIAASTALEKTAAFGIAPENVFGFWEWVGGRFSVCSAVGMLPLSLHYGADVTKQFLAGAHDMDTHFTTAPLERNLPVLMGLLGVWNSTFLDYGCRAVLPYSQALVRFAAHVQQLEMESNGKTVAMDGSALPFEAGEIIFGEPGTNGQHSFYQLMHQGRAIPAEFIGFCKSQVPMHLDGEPVSNHDELMSNFFAQPDALACGKTLADCEAEGIPPVLQRHKVFGGNRPSLSLLMPELTPFSCGQLLALYEHRVAVQGFVWGINSFDQWGVELGKALAKGVRGQFEKSRGSGAAVAGFNPSTTALLQRYLKD